MNFYKQFSLNQVFSPRCDVIECTSAIFAFFSLAAHRGPLMYLLYKTFCNYGLRNIFLWHYMFEMVSMTVVPVVLMLALMTYMFKIALITVMYVTYCMCMMILMAVVSLGGHGDYAVHDVLDNEPVYSDIILSGIIASFVKQNQAISFRFVPWSDYFSKLDKLSKFITLPFRDEFTDRNFAGNPRWVEVNYAQSGMTTYVYIFSLFSLLLLFHPSPTWLAFHNGLTTTLYHRTLFVVFVRSHNFPVGRPEPGSTQKRVAGSTNRSLGIQSVFTQHVVYLQSI